MYNMKSKSAISLILVVLLIGVWGYLAINGAEIGKYDVLSYSQGISLGLDLRGGVYVVYEASIPEGQETEASFGTLIDGTIKKLQTRLTEKGFTEATVSQQGSNRVRVEIPDVKDPQEILDIMGTPGRLTFVGPDNAVILEGKNVKTATAGYESGQPVIFFSLDSEGSELFAKATEKFIGQAISIYLDDRLLSAPTVNTTITGGQGYISGEPTYEAAAETASLIQSGALPLDLAQLELRTISATLGEDALSTSVMAGAIGFACVILFLIIVYRLPGLMASLALCLYLLIDLLLIATLPGVQLTLPGVAGVILSIGMAIDGNVIIFERIKEELRNGKTVRASVEAGFKNALSAIIDSGITSLIAAAVLGFFGTGSIKGFAITLGIGVVVAMFSSVVITRFLLRRMIGLNVIKRSLYGVSEKPVEKTKEAKKGLSVMRSFKPAVIIMAVIIVAGIGIGAAQGGLNMGVDFSGGTMITIAIPGDFDTAQVTEAFSEQGIGAVVSKAGEGDASTALVRIAQLNNPEEEAVLLAAVETKLASVYPGTVIDAKEHVGAVAGADLIRNAVLSVLIACVLMAAYIWIRFELKSGVSTVVGIFVSVLLMLAFVAITQTQINSPFIAAAMTVVGYSINNTIVIFDRIRENGKKYPVRDVTRGEVADISVRESLIRTINTTVTTLVMLVLLYAFGVESIKEFTLPLLAGLVGGVFTSVFIAPAMWGRWMDADSGRRGKTKATVKPKRA